MKKWIIFDLDEVVINLRHPIADALHKSVGTYINPDEWYQHDLEDLYNITPEKFLDALFEHNVLENGILENGVLECMTMLKEQGYHIGVCTARGWHPRGLEISQEMITTNGLPVDHIVAVGLRESKKDAMLSSFDGEIVAFIDDNPKHINELSAHGIKTIIQHRPWNATLPHDRVANLVDFAKLVIFQESLKSAPSLEL